MAQHRTKQDKLKAQIRRELMQYSLNDVNEKDTLVTSEKKTAHNTNSSPSSSVTSLINVQHIRGDILRTILSLAAVLCLLALALTQL